jgi:choline dehydrogenase
VTKILLEGDTATGVIFRSTNGSSTLYEVQAKREVILAAGTIHSPQVLQLSGIGPKPLLQSAGISVEVDLPGVGQNFQDHPELNMTFQSKYSSLFFIITRG